MKTLVSPFLIWFLGVAAGLLAGCASPAQSGAMVGRQLPHAVSPHDPVLVMVSGGEQTDPLWTSEISNEDFASALAASLRKTGLFTAVLQSGTAVFELEAKLEDVEQPMAGFDMTVALRVDWRLTRVADGQVQWHDKVLSTFTATPGDAFVGITRLRLADEGAARVNIEHALAELAGVKF